MPCVKAVTNIFKAKKYFMEFLFIDMLINLPKLHAFMINAIEIHRGDHECREHCVCHQAKVYLS